MGEDTKFAQIESVIAAAKKDAAKFYNTGNKAAGTRLRAALLQIKNLAHEGRKEVSEIKSEEI